MVEESLHDGRLLLEAAKVVADELQGQSNYSSATHAASVAVLLLTDCNDYRSKMHADLPRSLCSPP